MEVSIMTHSMIVGIIMAKQEMHSKKHAAICMHWNEIAKENKGCCSWLKQKHASNLCDKIELDCINTMVIAVLYTINVYKCIVWNSACIID